MTIQENSYRATHWSYGAHEEVVWRFLSPRGLALELCPADWLQRLRTKTELENSGWAQFFLYQTLYCVDVEKPACEEAAARVHNKENPTGFIFRTGRISCKSVSAGAPEA